MDTVPDLNLLSLLEERYLIEDSLLESKLIKAYSNVGVGIRRPFSKSKEEAIQKYLTRMEKDLAKMKELKKKYNSKGTLGKTIQNIVSDNNIHNINYRIDAIEKAIKHQKEKLKELGKK